MCFLGSPAAGLAESLILGTVLGKLLLNLKSLKRQYSRESKIFIRGMVLGNRTFYRDADCFFVYCIETEIFHCPVSQVRIASWYGLIGQKMYKWQKLHFLSIFGDFLKFIFTVYFYVFEIRIKFCVFYIGINLWAKTIYIIFSLE